jgi:hypothetical protein
MYWYKCVYVCNYVFIYLCRYWLLLLIIIDSKWLWRPSQTRFVKLRQPTCDLFHPTCRLVTSSVLYTCQHFLPVVGLFTQCVKTGACSNFFYHGATALSGLGPPHYRGFKVTFRHITVGRTPLDEWSARPGKTRHSQEKKDPCPRRNSNP